MSQPTSAVFNLEQWENFTQVQKKAREAFWKFKYLSVGGAMGGGKSYFLRSMAVEALLTYFAKYGATGVQVGIFCEDFPALQGRQISKIKEHYPEWLGQWVETRKSFELHKEYGSGVIAFRNLDNPSRYDSEEFAVIFIDECQKQKRSDFDTLRRRIRWPNINGDVHFCGSWNPPKQNEDPWARDLFYDKQFTEGELEQDQFHHVQFPPQDNPYLPKDYALQFSGLKKEERDAYLAGDAHAFDSAIDDNGYRPILTAQEVQARIIPRALHYSEPAVLAIDPGGGGDETSAIIRDLATVELVFNQKTPDTLSCIPTMMQILRENRGIRYCAIDKTGLGFNFYNRIRELVMSDPELSERVTMIPVQFGEKSQQPQRFKNKKMELFWKLKEDAKNVQYVEDEDKPWSQIPKCRYFVPSDQLHMFMEPKADVLARGEKSQNAADALAVSYAADLKKPIGWTKQFTDRSKSVWNE